GGSSLESAIAAAFDAAERESAGTRRGDRVDPETLRARVVSLQASIPANWNVRLEPASPTRESATRHLRFLTCHAFANWAAHLGQDLQAWLDAVVSAHALVASGFSVREADLWLRHLTPTAGLSDAPATAARRVHSPEA